MGTRRVAVVTDSTSSLPAGLAAQHAVDVVPLQVTLGDRCGLEGVDIGPAEVAAALRAHEAVTTSRPTPAALAAAYATAADRLGVRQVVAVHLSGRLSGTVEAARLGAQADGLDVCVVDARSIAMGLGVAVLAAARVAAAGGSVDEVVAAADEAERQTWTIFFVDTLEYLRRGGRIGAAAGLLGSALAVKPLLHLVDGQFVPLEKVRTAGRALARLADLTVASAREGPVDVAVHHLAAPGRADRLAEELRGRLPGLQQLWISEVGAVVGAHAGPGMVGVVVHRLAG